jgi:hypothetical protein
MDLFEVKLNFIFIILFLIFIYYLLIFKKIIYIISNKLKSNFKIL